jgi:glycerophosphoryl diester phosphodiesterase
VKNLTRAFAAIVAAIITTPFLNLGAHAVTYPTLVGHRGVGDPWTAQLGIPENSVPAIKWAAAHHADIVEGDVQQTRDGKMVMMHDETIDRTTNRTGRVIDRDLSYITAAWLEIPRDSNNNGDPDNTAYHPPSFHYWLDVAKDTNKLVFVELKNSAEWSKADVKRYVDELDRQGMRSRVITAGSETKLAYFRDITGGGKRSWNVDSRPSVTKIKSVVGSNGYVTMRLITGEADPSYVAKLQSSGLKVLLWTLDREDHYRRALPIGAYGWMCDNTDDAFKWLEAHGA